MFEKEDINMRYFTIMMNVAFFALAFVGCNDNSCEKQLDDYESCLLSQIDAFSCNELNDTKIT